MAYFLYNLALCLILSTCLFVLLVYRLRVNREQKNRYPAGFLMPVVLAAIFIVLTLQLTVPRVLDSFSIITRRYNVEEKSLTSDQIEKNAFTIDDRVYFFNGFKLDPEPDVHYRISSTLRSRYIISMSQIVEGDAEIVSASN